MSERCAWIEEKAANPDPLAWLPLIEDLGHTLFTQAPGTLYAKVKAILADPTPQDRVDALVQLVLSTRTSLEHKDAELDRKLVTAASNAISILNYGRLCGRLAFEFVRVKDWSHIRVPNANLNMATLVDCNFDYADLSGATLFRARLEGSSFRHANLSGVRTFESAPLVCDSLTLEDKPEHHIQSDSIVFSQDASRLAYSKYQSVVRVWSTKTFERVAVLQHSDLVATFAFSPTADILAVGTIDASIYLWDLHTSALLVHVKDVPSSVVSVALSPDMYYLASGLRNGELHLWRYANQQLNHVAVLNGHDRLVSCLAFSRESMLLASADSSGLTQCWDIATLQSIQRFRVPCEPPKLSFSPDSAHLAVQTYSLDVLEISTGTVSVLKPPPLCIRVPSEQKESISDEMTLDPPEIECASKLRELGFESPWESISYLWLDLPFAPYYTTAVAVAPNGAQMAVTVQPKNSSVAKNGTWIQLLEPTPVLAFIDNLLAHLNLQRGVPYFPMSIESIACTHDGKTLAILGNVPQKYEPGEQQAFISLWDLETGAFKTNVGGLPTQGKPIDVFLPHGAVLGTTTLSAHFWELEQGSVPSRRRFGVRGKPHDKLHQSVATPEGGMVCMFRKGEVWPFNGFSVRVNEEWTDRKFKVGLTKRCKCMGGALSRDQILLATVHYIPAAAEVAQQRNKEGVRMETIQVSISRLDEARRVAFKRFLADTTGIRSKIRIAYSPDEKHILLAGPDQHLRVWTRDNLTLTQVLAGHASYVHEAAYSSDGRYIFSAGADRTLRVWDALAGQCISVTQVLDPIHLMLWVPTHEFLLTANNTNTFVRVWQLADDDEDTQVEDHRQRTPRFELVRVIGMSAGIDMRADFEGARMDPDFANLHRALVERENGEDSDSDSSEDNDGDSD